MPIANLNKSKAFDSSVIFIPEYMLNALHNENMSFDKYFGYLRDMKTKLPANFNGCPWEAYRLVMGSEDATPELKSLSDELEKIHFELFDTLGSYEVRNLFHLNKLLYDFLELSVYDSGSGIEMNIFNENIVKRYNVYMNEDKDFLALFRSNDEIEFNNTYDIIDAGVTIVVVKEGFSNYLTKQAKVEFLRDLVDTRAIVMGNSIYSSSLLTSYIQNKLSN